MQDAWSSLQYFKMFFPSDIINGWRSHENLPAMTSGQDNNKLKGSTHLIYLLNDFLLAIIGQIETLCKYILLINLAIN